MRKILCLLILILCSPCWADAIAHYKMNDNAASTTVVDTTGNHNGDFNDVTGDANTSAHSVAGKIGTALEFDGTDDYIVIVDHDDFSFGDGSNDSSFSISAWIYIHDTSKFEVLSKRNTTTKEWRLGTGIPGLVNKMTFIVYDESDPSAPDDYILIDEIPLLNTNQWYHLVVTYNGNGSTSGLDMYVDNSPEPHGHGTGGSYGAMNNTANNVNIGKAKSAQLTDGFIDNIMLFDAVLSAHERQRLYNNGNGTEQLADLNQVTRNPRRSVTSPLPTRSRYEF